MAIRDELKEQFQFMGYTATDSVLDKCVKLCEEYSLDAEALAEQWFTYSTNYMNNVSPTIDGLINMERKELKIKKSPPSTPKHTENRSRLPDSELSEVVYGTPKTNAKRLPSPVQESTPKRLNQSIPLEIEETINSSSYHERSNSGAVVVKYGTEVERTFWQNSSKSNLKFDVKLHGQSDNWLSSSKRYMYEIMGAKATSMDRMMSTLEHCFLHKYNMDTIFENVNIIRFGRIIGDADGKLNSASVVLEGRQKPQLNNSIPMNLNRLGNYAIFPGQSVMVAGDRVNNTLVVKQLYSDSTPLLPEKPPEFTSPLHLVIAAGPYTLQDSLNYQPFQDLIKYLSQNVPDILILMGPFIDASHSSIKEGSLAETFDSFFERLIEGIMSPFKDTNTQVVLIPSHKDVHHHVVYPTLPYKLRMQFPNLHCVPNPCMLDINGLVIGGTTADILFHLGKEELSSMQGVDRLSRLCSHIINQQNFYPLHPSHPEMFIDHEMMEQYGMMTTMPHLLILPSNLKGFVKNVAGCLVVNPERLVKGYVGGTFARLKISPGDKSIVTKTSAEIVQI